MTWKKAALWAAFFVVLAVIGTDGFDEQVTRGTTERGEGTGGVAVPGDRDDRDRTQTDEQPAGQDARGKVQRVVDGDTIKVHLGPRTETVRYIGVDTPETVKQGTAVQCFGPEASAFNNRLVDRKAVRLVYDKERRDRYGRLLAYVYVGKSFINAELIKRGYATALRFPPNTAHADEFDRLQRIAASRGRGLWRACPKPVG